MKQQILFVEPPKHYWFVMGEYLSPPSSLLILSAYVERELPDVMVDVLDCQAERLGWKGLEQRVATLQPTIICTSGFTTNAYSCARTCEIAKKVNENIVTVAGGIHFSYTPDESLRNYPEIDYIVRGEGEQTLVNLIKTLHQEGSIYNVQGISWRHNGTIVHNPPQPLIENLDTLPYPAYHLVEQHLKKYHFTMMTGKNTIYMIIEGARGCEHRCSFCTQWNHWGNRWRTKSAKRIADEIEYMHETYGGVFLWFTDDHMNLRQRGKPLYEELRHRRCKDDIKVFFQARTDDIIHHPEVLGNLREVGTHWILCGVESDSAEQLKEYNKNICAADAYTAMKLLHHYDIFAQAMFVIGGRKDTHESIERLRRYSEDITPDFAIYTTLTPFPGTSFYDAAKKNGWIQDTNYANYDMTHAIMPTEMLTRQEVQEELYRCYYSYYGSVAKGIAGVFAKNKLKRTVYRHMAGQHVLSRLRRLI
jgi:anaerobic magnesium-protoporphyrin IX monomethyl ester cyclase